MIMMLPVTMMILLLVLLLVIIIITFVFSSLLFRCPLRFQCAAAWAARAPSPAARSKSPCWPLPLRVTARSFAQPLVAAL